MTSEIDMEERPLRELFDTGLRNIGHEIKSRLAAHGFFGVMTNIDTATDTGAAGSRIEIAVKGRTAERSFSRQDIENCHLRVGGPVLEGIISMVDQLRAG